MKGSNGPIEDTACLKICRKVVHPLSGLVTAACLLEFIGWSGAITDWQHWCTTLTGIGFGLERGWVFRKLNPRGMERKRLEMHVAFGILVFLVSLVLLVLPRPASGDWPPGGHVFVQISVLVSALASVVFHQTRYTARAFHPGMVLIGSFFLIIVAGCLLLKMPLCVVPGATCSWLDAIFTSTSAVCVTGLAVQNTATFFSPTGQTVILLLIQIGGLGIMTLTFFAAVVLFEGLSLHDRLLLGKMIQENRLARVGETLAFIVILTFVCESVGAVVLFLGMDGATDFGTRVFDAVFHSVSAFCNAGFSIFPDGLASGVVNGNWIWQVCIMALIIIGGLGSLVNEDLTLWATAKVKRKIMGHDIPRRRLRVHTRLVLTITLALVVGGAAVIMATEYLLWNGPKNGGTVLTAFFHSVTARTAGFNTVPMQQIGPLTIQALMILMIIGGSPGGTAGGLRTTVAAIGLAQLWNQLRMGPGGIVAFNRTIPRETGTQALGLIVLVGLWLVANFVIFQILETGSGVSETKLLFELISAFATVGLSLDLTPMLTDGGKILMVVNMFVGRIGLLTVCATLLPRNSRPAPGKPAENILLT